VRVLVTPSLNRALAGLVAPIAAQLGVAGHPPGQRGSIDGNQGSA